jgi:hypothetical protein
MLFSFLPWRNATNQSTINANNAKLLPRFVVEELFKQNATFCRNAPTFSRAQFVAFPKQKRMRNRRRANEATHTFELHFLAIQSLESSNKEFLPFFFFFLRKKRKTWRDASPHNVAFDDFACNGIPRESKRSGSRNANKQKLILGFGPNIAIFCTKNTQKQVVRKIVAVSSGLFHFRPSRKAKANQQRKTANKKQCAK